MSGGARRRLIAGVLAMTLYTLGALCALSAAPALGLVGEFGEEGEGAGQFLSNANGLAINQESGDVYLADTQNKRIVQFTAEGQFVRTWGYGVSDGSEAFGICEAPGPCQPGIAGSGGGQLSVPRGVAIDNSAGLTHGDVYVQDTANHRVERYGPNGEFILTFGDSVNKTAQEKGETANEDVCPVNPGDECQAGTSGSGPGQLGSFGRNGIAVDPGGTIYVAGGSRVQKFSPGGVFEGPGIALAETGFISGLLVDSSGDMYVLRETLEGVRKYDGAGVEQGEARDPGVGGLSPSIAIGSGDELLVSDPEKKRILAYDPTGTQTLSVPEPGAGDASGGMAFALKALYILHNTPPRVTTLTLPPSGPLILSESASELLPTSAKLEATVNPEGPEATKCHFQYGISTAYGQETPEEELVGEAFSDQTVSAPISGLQPAGEYHFRALCENAAKQLSEGPDQTFTSAPPVSIEDESATEVRSSSAKLNAVLNAHGLPSEFHFEYGLTTAYEKGAVPVPDASAGEGSEDASFGVKIQELLANSTYHYRVVAHNSLGVSIGVDRTFTTQGEAPALADERAYEMVSPPVKHGVSLEAITREGGLIEAAPDGSGLAYIALGPTDTEPAGNRSSNLSQLVAKRGAGVWSTQDVATPHQAVAGLIPGNPSEYKQFSSDLSRGVVEPEGATPLSPQTSEKTPYRREPDGKYTPLVNAGNVPAGTKFGGTEVLFESFERGVTLIAGTPDMSHVLLESPSSLVQGFEAGEEPSVYEWSEGALQAVSILPNGASPASEGASASAGDGSRQLRGAISADGTRVFFSTGPNNRLYVRNMARGETLRIDEAEAGVKASDGGARFQLATADGSKVFFTDASRLTKDATAKSSAPDLYQCTILESAGKLTCQLKDLSVDEHPGQAADVQGAVPGADEEGRQVYFVARGALAEGAVSGACPDASEGQCLNLYAEDTQTLSKRLVAVLAQGDGRDWGVSNDLGEVTSRVSPNGRYLAFMSKRSLTGYDNHDAQSGAQDQEVFLYDNETGRLGCASCDPSGQRPTGVFDDGQFPGLLVERLGLWREQWLAASIPGWTRIDLGHALHQARYLSNSGRLFFNSPVGLVAGDGNGTQDVYEYEPEGVGSCESPQGCINLISSGSSSEESALLDASENGGDIFFLTAAQLSPTDKDKAFDVYDAHVCSEAPGCPPQAIGSPPPCVSADACRSAPTPQPGSFSAPASSTFSGAGNPTPPLPAKAKLTRAQQLAKALRACKKKPKRKRAACERQARKRFGPAHKAKAKAKARAKARKGAAKKRGEK